MIDRLRTFAALVLVALASCAGPSRPKDPAAFYDADLKPRLVPLLEEAIRFPTVKGNIAARDAQQAWLIKTGTAMGFTTRNAGKVVEVELAGPTGAPVLGLVAHGDVQPVDEKAWSIPPFAGADKDGYVLGRGAADDKGPIVQALLAMKALDAAGPARSHTIRLLVGSDEESDNLDMKEYLAGHAPPDYSLVLDYDFPVVVGEKAWTGLYLDAKPGARSNAELPFRIKSLSAGLSASIVPDRAELVLQWIRGVPQWGSLVARLQERPLPEGTRLEFIDDPGGTLTVIAHGKSAHGGTNPEGGRNALVALARVTENLLPASGENDLLAFARMAGRDIYGTGLGLTESDPLWGRHIVNVGTIKPRDDGSLRLEVSIRRPPPRTGQQIKAYLTDVVRRFNARTGAKLAMDGYWDDEPLSFDPECKLVKRLLAVYARATGTPAPPFVGGGGSYAKRLPSSIAFGMWFPGKPYPGHDVDEKISIDDLHRGTHVLIAALADIACGPKIDAPFAR
ncbi:MAG TPA: Sapep family Mn(2+)-dependent dipeptidase [Candidatus Polarisedimenticolaceae bacterium]|nr:Sapep family Mn(2+)-dependent dipeptidase [Candidatus Polarisedimenticolaceae bacterium]